LVEGGVEARTFARATHDAGVDASGQWQVAQARGDEVFALERIENFE
jgi:hypothetical protein